MKDKLLGYYRTLRHNVKYKENYFRNAVILLSVALILDILLLWMVS